MSKYTAQQIYALGQFINANQSEFPKYRIGNEIRHLEYNAQRNLPEASEAYFQKHLHTTVDKAMAEAAAVMERQAGPQKPSSLQDNGAVAVRIVDLSHQGQPIPQNPNTLVANQCAGSCGRTIAVPLGQVGQLPSNLNTCPECLKIAQAQVASDEAALKQFLIDCPQFYLHADNFALLDSEITRRKLTKLTSDDLLRIYIENRDLFLARLTVDQLDALTSAEVAAREKIDPALGGAIAAMNALAKPQETQAWSSNKQRFGQTFQRQGMSSQGSR
jgi:hypothetical protein